MSPRSKREYLEAIFLRYKKAPPKEKTIILKSAKLKGKGLILFLKYLLRVEQIVLFVITLKRTNSNERCNYY
jgi:hypothetical protein